MLYLLKCIFVCRFGSSIMISVSNTYQNLRHTLTSYFIVALLITLLSFVSRRAVLCQLHATLLVKPLCDIPHNVFWHCWQYFIIVYHGLLVCELMTVFYHCLLWVASLWTYVLAAKIVGFHFAWWLVMGLQWVRYANNWKRGHCMRDGVVSLIAILVNFIFWVPRIACALFLVGCPPSHEPVFIPVAKAAQYKMPLCFDVPLNTIQTILLC